MILTNGRIFPLDPVYRGASALAIRGATIQAIGSDEEMGVFSGARREVLNLEGCTVLPGFVDSHVHFLSYAQLNERVDLQGAVSLEETLRRVRRWVDSVPAGEWVRGRGWNQNLWPSASFPTATDLDRVSPNHPVYLVAQSGHAAWANTRALEAAGITASHHDPPGGEIQRDAAGGPTGILFEENAMNLVKDVIGEQDPAEAAAMMEQALPDLWNAGITGVHCMDGWVAYQALKSLHGTGELQLRVVKYLPLDHLDEAIELGLRSGQGDDWFRIGGLKLFADGALGVRTAVLFEPYEGEVDNRGIMTLSVQEMETIGRQACAAGLSLAVHAIGDRANSLVLDLFESLPRVPALSHRIEHVQMLRPEDAERLVGANVTASMQPIHAPSDYEMAEACWGERTRFAYAPRTLLARGARLAFGSDAPVEPIDPLLGIHAAVTRRRTDGSPGPEGWHPEQRLTTYQAVAGFTIGPAQAAGMAHKVGTLAPGKLADLVVLDRDIFAIDPMDIPSTKVLGTMIGGTWVKPLAL